MQYIYPVGQECPQTGDIHSKGLRHFAMTVDDIDACVHKLKEHEVEMLSNIVDVPRSVVEQGKRLCYFKAPDDVVIELAAYGYTSNES